VFKTASNDSKYFNLVPNLLIIETVETVGSLGPKIMFSLSIINFETIQDQTVPMSDVNLT
jgi:hypothetical protein